MKELNTQDDIIKLELDIGENIQNITKGRNINKLSDEELVLLNNLYDEINSKLGEKNKYSKEELEELKCEIKSMLKRLKNSNS